jgi:LmbE family N-acetylglucosaminyl deacetylase
MGQITDSFDEVFDGKNRVLIVAAHPDDNEVICGGLVARLTSSGRRVRLLVTTNGEKGTEDKPIDPKVLSKNRLREQQKAALVLDIKATDNFNLQIADGELEASLENIAKVVWHIREFKPDIVITHNPDEVINTFSSKAGIRWVNHRDHRHTGLITTDAVYPYSRDTAFFPEQLAAGLSPHIVLTLTFRLL